MESLKDQIIGTIETRSQDELAQLSRQFARAASEEREAILAEMELEQFIIETADVCLSR